MKRPECDQLRNKLLKFLSENEKNIKKKSKNQHNKQIFKTEINNFIDSFEEDFQNLFNF